MEGGGEHSRRLQETVEELRRLGSEALLEGRLEQAQGILNALIALEPLGLRADTEIDSDDQVPPEAPTLPSEACEEDPPVVVPMEAPTLVVEPASVNVEPAMEQGITDEPEFTRTDSDPAPSGVPSAREAAAERRSRGTVRKGLERFFGASKHLVESEGKRVPFELRNVICLGRALLDGDKLDPGQQSAVHEEIARLANALAKTEYGEFFGASASRHLSSEVWEQFAQAYACLGAAFDCLEWLETEAFIDEEEERRLVSLCAAAESAVHRLVEKHTFGVVEAIQRDLHEEILLAQRWEVPIEWWRAEANGGPTLKSMLAEASHLDPILTRAKSKSERRLRAETVLEMLLTVLADPTSDTFVDDLVACIRENLDAGVPPSNRELRDLTLPFRALIEEVDEPKLRRFVSYLREDETKALAAHRVHVEIDLPESPASYDQRERLSALLKGKTALFVGGNPQEKKRRELQEALGLQEIIWPDSDETTHSDRFVKQIDKADLVCLIIRWARHGRRGVLDEAKARGKMTAVLPRGIGVNRVLCDLDDQLAPARRKKKRAVASKK